MKALGMYAGENTEAEHQAEAARLGGETYYRMMLANALSGGVEANALMANASGVTVEAEDFVAKCYLLPFLKKRFVRCGH
jgi:hypothetical protein